MTDKLKNQLTFLIEADRMKNILRQTMLMDKSRQETDAEHSWHFALTALTLYEYVSLDNVDINRVIKMAILHDMVEIYAGDTFAYDETGNKDKEEREKYAADKLFSLLPAEQCNEFRELWEEFDKAETPDAMYAAAIDRVQPFISNYITGGYTWVKYKIHADQVYKRMAPVKDVLPELWEFIEFVINDSCQKGYLTP